MKRRGTPMKELDEAVDIFGDAPEVEFSFLLIPMPTFKIANEVARMQGIGVTEVFQRAVLQYLQTALNESETLKRDEPSGPAAPEPMVVMRKKNNR